LESIPATASVEAPGEPALRYLLSRLLR